ncbi:MAG: hypothetical protein D6729_05565, partial [Deltaproteobacteria bacterium]
VPTATAAERRAPPETSPEAAGRPTSPPHTLRGRLAAYLARAPAESLRFDTAIALYQGAKAGAPESDPGERAWIAVAMRRALAEATKDEDHPHLRLLGRPVAVTRRQVQGFSPPDAGGGAPSPRVNVNRVVTEALYCDRFGLRPATLAYVTGPMRDAGGYHSCHGLWALTLARDRGCPSQAAFAAAAAPLRAEIQAALAAAGPPATLADLDLFAERQLMLLLAGEPPPADLAARLTPAADRLVLRRPHTPLSVHAAALLFWLLSEAAAAPGAP